MLYEDSFQGRLHSSDLDLARAQSDRRSNTDKLTDDDEDAKAFRDQSLDDILATRSKAVVLASDTSGGALESLSSATFVASKEEDKIALDDPDFWSVTQRPFPNVSELQLWEDGVFMKPSTRL